jgi:hypothetical protein
VDLGKPLQNRQAVDLPPRPAASICSSDEDVGAMRRSRERRRRVVDGDDGTLGVARHRDPHGTGRTAFARSRCSGACRPSPRP